MGSKDKIMGLKDVILLNIVAVFGVAFFTSAAKMGPSQILLWVLAALLFFIPEGLVVAELSTAWPLEGGLGAWCKEAFGKKTGFIISWIYCINTVIYFPALLMSTSVFFAYGVDNPALADSKVYICIFSILFIWLLTFANIKGFDLSKKINNFSSAFAFCITGLLVVLALYWVFGLKQPVQTHYTLKSMVPKFSDLGSLVFFSTMIFALSGLELPPTLIGKIKDPEKNFPKAILVASIVLPILFILGTTALTMIMTPDKVGLTNGMINAIEIVCNAGGIHWFVIIIALAILLFRIGSVNAWLLSPMVMFIESSKDILPSWFTKMDEKRNTPKNALIIQAAVVSVLTLMAYSMPTVESAYWLMAAMATILYFIPFLAMFAAFIKLRKMYPDTPRKYKVPGGITIPAIGFAVVLISTILACLPPTGVDVGEIIKYELKLIGGAAIFAAIGYVFYAVYKNKNKKQVSE